MKFKNTKTGDIVDVPDASQLPAGTWMQMDATATGQEVCSPAMQCAGPSPPVSLTPGGYQVQGQVVCQPPPQPVKTYKLQSCDPQLFGDCRCWAWFKDVLGGWKVCRNVDVGWEDTELDSCPVNLAPIMYDPTTGAFYKFVCDGVYINELHEDEWTGWSLFTGGNIPNCLQEIYIDSVGQIYYLAVPSVQSQKTVIDDHPFCLTGY